MGTDDNMKAIVRAIDHNKRLSTLRLDEGMFSELKRNADGAGVSLETAALILATDGRTSRFKGKFYVEVFSTAQ